MATLEEISEPGRLAEPGEGISAREPGLAGLGQARAHRAVQRVEVLCAE